MYSKLDFPRCSKHGAVAVGVLESPVCVRDDKRNLRDHVRETFMGWWSKSTLSSCRRTRSGISVSFKPSTVKWFSASLREVIYYESYLEFHHHFYFNTTSWVLESTLIGRALVMLKFEVHLLEATDPVLKRCVLRPPGVRRGNNKDSIAGQHLLQIFGKCFLQQTDNIFFTLDCKSHCRGYWSRSIRLQPKMRSNFWLVSSFCLWLSPW